MNKNINYYSQYIDNKQENLVFLGPKFSVAPMMDWTDRHCRYFHRLLTKHALLYTEMVVADAIIHGDAGRHLDFSEEEHPIALQLGGSDPQKLVHAVNLARDWGYDEFNLNVGCPSDRVRSGAFGACLMLVPDKVAQCVAALKAETEIPVTVKCRISVDNQDTEKALDDMADAVFDAGCDALWVHARKAWLQGLSPKENRDIPPLDYARVQRLKQRYPNKFIGINGGIMTLDEGSRFTPPLDGMMLGRAAYQNPSLLLDVDQKIYGSKIPPITMNDLAERMMAYTARHIERGGRANHITRHMIGLFQGKPGARRYRQILSVDASKPGADERVIEKAFKAIGAANRVTA